MKRYIIGLCAWLLLAGSVKTVAQTDDIVVSDFQRAVTDLTASMNPVMDNNGEVCAVLKFFVRDTTFVIEPNLGFLRRESKVGEIRLWVPAGTKRLTVRHAGLYPLRDYVIPEVVESKRAYHAVIAAKEAPTPTVAREPRVPESTTPVKATEEKPQTKPKTPKVTAPSETRFFVAPGLLVAPKLGLSLALGVNANRHVIEADVALALGKTDSLHYYEGSTWDASYQYQLLKAGLRYGREFLTKGTDKLTFTYTPMVGIQSAMAMGSGTDNEKTENGKKGVFKNGAALSASVGVRLALRFGESFACYVRPELNLALYKSDSYKLMTEGNSAIKNWANGFALDAGIMISF